MSDKKNVFVFYSLLLKDILDLKKNKKQTLLRDSVELSKGRGDYVLDKMC